METVMLTWNFRNLITIALMAWLGYQLTTLAAKAWQQRQAS